MLDKYHSKIAALTTISAIFGFLLQGTIQHAYAQYSMCGDYICDAMYEDITTCPTDCGSTAFGCGDGFCDSAMGEDFTTCSTDCGSTSTCGDAMCDAGEDSTNCPTDCMSADCGNGMCDAGEDETSCPVDCNSCGNGVCDAGEDYSSCMSDCEMPYCGNNIIDTSISEQCDDGNQDNYDYCSQMCTTCPSHNYAESPEFDEGVSNAESVFSEYSDEFELNCVLRDLNLGQYDFQAVLDELDIDVDDLEAAPSVDTGNGDYYYEPFMLSFDSSEEEFNAFVQMNPNDQNTQLYQIAEAEFKKYADLYQTLGIEYNSVLAVYRSLKPVAPTVDSNGNHISLGQQLIELKRQKDELLKAKDHLIAVYSSLSSALEKIKEARTMIQDAFAETDTAESNILFGNAVTKLGTANGDLMSAYPSIIKARNIVYLY
ncbi:DUF4215 domain-containing protein [Candidatus Peribacteria bacterium]|nr:DUF4215 domain-containing protein [Candidatus Peribacteria bacterium]